MTSVLSFKQFPSISHVMFRTLLNPPVAALAPCPSTSPSLLLPSMGPSTTTPPSGLVFGRFAEQSPLESQGGVHGQVRLTYHQSTQTDITTSTGVSWVRLVTLEFCQPKLTGGVGLVRLVRMVKEEGGEKG